MITKSTKKVFIKSGKLESTIYTANMALKTKQTTCISQNDRPKTTQITEFKRLPRRTLPEMAFIGFYWVKSRRV